MISTTTLARVGFVAMALAAASAAHAVEIRSGTIGFHNDVRSYDFTLAAPGTVDIASTSWQYGLNFDPAASVWARSGADYTLLAQNDDDEISAYDPAGNFNFRVQLSLAAGSYRVSLVAAPNAPVGTLFSQGFTANGETPIALADWTQPSANPNFPDQKGGFYSITFAGVTSVSAQPVPEPATWLLMGLGAAGLVLRRRFL
jgi:hypothetical protein